MKKNWKMIYKRLKKEVKSQAKLYSTYIKPMNKCNFVEQLELCETINTLENILLTMDEIDGTNCCSVLFNNEQFKKWKKLILIK